VAARFLTDPDQMWAMAGRFEKHAQLLAAEGQRIWAASQDAPGADWNGAADATSIDGTAEMHWAFRNVVTMLRGVRDGLIRDANRYEEEAMVSRELLDSLSFSTSSLG
jgi:WXG100 family type VII secretion target